MTERLSQAEPDIRRMDTLSEQVRLLYGSTDFAVAGNILAASILVYLNRATAAHAVLFSWWVYIILVSICRYNLARSYRRSSTASQETGRWQTSYAVVAGLAGVGWGIAGFVLYQEANLANQVFLVLVLGGMMLGSASLLAPRPEAFLAFMISIAVGPITRLLIEGDAVHLVMALLAALFTFATLIMTVRIHRTIASSLDLQFENRSLLADLWAAKNRAESLNQVLELRVRERTAELRNSAEQLRTEIVQREKIEEELLRARKLESLGVLAGGIAHDFNNFLTVIQGNIELAKVRLDVHHPLQQILDQAADTCQRAALLSSQLLTFAKGGAPVRRVASMAKIVTEAVRLARAGAPVSIALRIAEDLHSCFVDPGQIGQVLHNILLNAKQAMGQGGIIDVRAENYEASGGAEEQPRVRITIRDYGCGIPADVLPRIFDPYFTTKPGGSGLGLATAHSIIAKHDGRIFVESRPGQGTAFTIILPAASESPTREAPTIAEVQTGKERILVMDDDEAIRNLVEAVLTGFGYQTQTVRDGAEAIVAYEVAKAAGKPFDAALLDLTVSGGMGGLEAAGKLKEFDPACKLIVSSGYSDTNTASEFGKYGFEGILPKPWTTKDLSRVLRQVLVGDSKPNEMPD